MNSAHLHLMSTHVPVVGTVLGIGVLVWGWARNSAEIERLSWRVLALAALLAAPAYLSGSPAAETLKGMAGITSEVVEQHEEVAQLALAASLVTGVVSVTGLVVFRRGRTISRWFRAALLLMSLVACGLLFWGANLGARIHHPEIRSGSGSAR